jgi:hypothetical protein
MQGEAYSTIQVGGHRGNSKRGVALVDHIDAEMVSAYHWSMNSDGYAKRVVYVGDKQLTVLMHRFLLGLGPGDPEADHINGNGLDNRRANLRVCTTAQNQQNRHDRPYRGTRRQARGNLWMAQVKLDGKHHHLGCYATREEAAAVAAAWRRQHMPYSRDARDAAA